MSPGRRRSLAWEVSGPKREVRRLFPIRPAPLPGPVRAGSHLPLRPLPPEIPPEVPCAPWWEHECNLTPRDPLLRHGQSQPEWQHSGCPHSCDPRGPPPLPVWLCLLPAPCPVLHPGNAQASSSPWSHYREAVRQLRAWALGTMIRLRAVCSWCELGQVAVTPGPWFLTCTMQGTTGRQEAVAAGQVASTAPGVSYQITAGCWKTVPAQPSWGRFPWGNPFSLLSPPLHPWLPLT